MASNQTQHLNLSQWEEDDEVLRADFNADNAKIDTAVGALTGTCSGLTARCGNCIVVAGTYVGTGVGGSGHPCRLSFPYKPMLVVLESGFVLPQGVQSVSSSYTSLTVSWSGYSVSWSANGGDSSAQCNYTGKTYHYVALLAKQTDSSASGSFSAS